MDQAGPSVGLPGDRADGKLFIIGYPTPYDDQQFVAVQPGAGGGTVARTSSRATRRRVCLRDVGQRPTAFAILNAEPVLATAADSLFQGAPLPTAITTGQLYAYDDHEQDEVKQNYAPTGGRRAGCQLADRHDDEGNLTFVGTGAPGASARSTPPRVSRSGPPRPTQRKPGR
jgi:hypothetical protein